MATGHIYVLTSKSEHPFIAKNRSVIHKIGVTGGDVKGRVANAKKDLLARGHTAKEIEAMPPAQVLLLSGYEQYLELRDDQQKWICLPYPEAEAGLKRSVEKHKKLQDENETDAVLAFNMLMLSDALGKIYSSSARTERKVAALRVIEAIRLHAAATNGQLPAKLSNITVVPVPDDPLRGKPFDYTRTGTTFTLSAPTPFGEEPGRYNTQSYEITLKAK